MADQQSNLQDLRERMRVQLQDYERRGLVVDAFEYMPLSNEDGGDYLARDDNGALYNAWMHKNEAGAWDVVFLNQEQAQSVYEGQAQDILNQHREAIANPETNGDLGWFDTRNPNGDPRDIPDDIGVSWGLMADDFRGLFDQEDFNLVRMTEEGPQIIEARNGLYPPEVFDSSSGGLQNGYRLQLTEPGTLPDGLPASALDENGIVNPAQVSGFVIFTQPNPDDPSKRTRFRPEEEGFAINRIRTNGPEQGVVDAAMAIGAHAASQKPGSEMVDINSDDFPVLEGLSQTSDPAQMADEPEDEVTLDDLAAPIPMAGSADNNVTLDDLAAPLPISAVEEMVYEFKDIEMTERYAPINENEFLEELRQVSQGHRDATGGYFGIDQVLDFISTEVNNARFAIQEGQSSEFYFDQIERFTNDHPAYADIVSHYALMEMTGQSPDRDQYEQMMRDRFEGKPVELTPFDQDDMKEALQEKILSGQNPAFEVTSMAHSNQLIANLNANQDPFALAQNAKDDLVFVEQQIRDMPETAQKIIIHAIEANPHYAEVIARFAANRLDDSVAPVGIGVFMNQIDAKAHAYQARPEALGAEFSNAAAPVEGPALGKEHYYGFADNMMFNIVRDEGMEAVLADHAENGINAFPYTPVIDPDVFPTGMVATVQNENGEILTKWADQNGNEVLFSAEDLGAHMSSLINTESSVNDQVEYFAQNPDVEPAVQAIALALHAADAVENGRVAPTNVIGSEPQTETAPSQYENGADAKVEPINYGTGNADGSISRFNI